MTDNRFALVAHWITSDPTVTFQVATHKSPDNWRDVVTVVDPEDCQHKAGQLCSECLEKRLETHHVAALDREGEPIWIDPTHPGPEVES